MRYVMAIDAGTGSIRAVLFDENGTQIAVAQREWRHLEEEGVAGSMAFDITHNWQLTAACIQEVIQTAQIDAEAIAAVSATSMREGIVLYDEKKDAIWGVANVDARAGEEVSLLKCSHEGIEEAFYRQSGQTFALGALPRLLWLKRHRPELYRKTAAISMIGDWVLAHLSGVIATDPSNAGTTGIFSLQERTWIPEMAEQVGIRSDIFPPVLEPGSVMGCVSETAAEQTGLSPRTKVVMGGGDVQLGSAGLGVVEVGDVAILGGSFWQQVANIPLSTKPPKDMSIRINPHVLKDQSQAEGITFFIER
jgi:autoinducer 2 (AI-2) kinase